jgi:type I restriction enzyme R subunit
VFRIFDAVDLYPHLQDLTEMKPVVVDPDISFEQLFAEFCRLQDEAHRDMVREQILVKMRQRIKRLHDQARALYQTETGETPEATLKRLTEEPAAVMAAWARERPNIGRILDWQTEGTEPILIPISHHPDQVIAVTRGYGAGQKPGDFLDGFTTFIRGNVNKIAALNLVVQRPRDLTRAELKALRLELDALGYSEANLRRAWSETTNADIAASIIGFVRQAALGDALIPFDVRVQSAMQRILGSRPWTDVQRKWLKRIAEQVVRELIVDRAAIDEDPFSKDGGFQRLNRVFDGRLEAVLSDINKELWKTAL